MATRDEAKQAILDRIHQFASDGDLRPYETGMVLQLAEAFAWLISPNNSHAGGGKDAPSS
jgi:hypothetical protein